MPIIKLHELIGSVRAYEMTIPARQHDEGVAFQVNAVDSKETINDDELMLIAGISTN